MLVARQLLDFTICVRALQATMLCRYSDLVRVLLDASSATTAAVGAVLVAFAPATPLTFAIDWARLLIARLVLHMLHMRTLTPTKLCLDGDDELSSLGASTTGGAAAAPLGEVALTINWARHITAHLRRCVAILMRALHSTIHCLLGNAKGFRLCAAATEVISGTFRHSTNSTSNFGIAHVIWAKVANAINRAIGLVAEGLCHFVLWWCVLAFHTAMLGW
jgi:hypothetical protein